MNNLKKSLYSAVFLSVLVIVTVTLIQLYGQSKIVSKCSYLDPITIDFLAFFARIIEHPHASLPRQATRILRICFGFSILTLHTIQFLHK